jgi:hypothetical protein
LGDALYSYGEDASVSQTQITHGENQPQGEFTPTTTLKTEYSQLNTPSPCLLEQIVMNVCRLASREKSSQTRSVGGGMTATPAIVCAACDRVFGSYEEFLSNTSALKPGCKETGVCADGEVVFEYRRCECQEVISVTRFNRRDETPFGVECRAYFTVAVMQLTETSGMSSEDARLIIRSIYEAVFANKENLSKKMEGL